MLCSLFYSIKEFVYYEIHLSYTAKGEGLAQDTTPTHLWKELNSYTLLQQYMVFMYTTRKYEGAQKFVASCSYRHRWRKFSH